MKSMSIAALVSVAGFAATASAQQCEWSQGCSDSSQSASAQTVAMTQGDTIVDVAVGAGSFKTLVAAVQAAGLADALSGEGPYTVFAPTDEAFAKLPAGTVETLLKPENKETLKSILLYHVVKGEAMAKTVVSQKQWDTLSGQRIDIKAGGNSVMVDKAKVLKTDIEASNGVIHVIDSVILPETKNIVEVAQGAGSFATLIAAAKAAGLADLLMSDGPFTVFAPTDEAFAALPEGTVQSLLRPENKDQLAAILKYHVVAGRVYSDQAIKAGRAETAMGQSVDITSGNGGVMVEEAKVVKADIEASNGVIHVINRVILPE